MTLKDSHAGILILVCAGAAAFTGYYGYKSRLARDKVVNDLVGVQDIINKKLEILHVAITNQPLSDRINPAGSSGRSHVSGVSGQATVAVTNPPAFRELFVYGRGLVSKQWRYDLLDGRQVGIGDVFEGQMLLRTTEHFAIFTDGLRAVSVIPRPVVEPPAEEKISDRLSDKSDAADDAS